MLFLLILSHFYFFLTLKVLIGKIDELLEFIDLIYK